MRRAAEHDSTNVGQEDGPFTRLLRHMEIIGFFCCCRFFSAGDFPSEQSAHGELRQCRITFAIVIFACSMVQTQSSSTVLESNIG